MPIVSQIICDRCQAVKKETNHWYTLVVTDRDVCIRPIASTPPGLSVPGAVPAIQYLCGRLCAVEALGNWMESLSGSSTVTNGCVEEVDVF
jgi:hypothetical protein